MTRYILATAVLLAACDEKKETPATASSASAATQAATSTPAPAVSAPPAPASASASAAPTDDAKLDGTAILSRMGTSVCNALDRCNPATLKALGGLDKCAATMTKSPPPGFNKKKAACTESQLTACLKVYESDAICDSLKGKAKKEKDPPECLACGIK